MMRGGVGLLGGRMGERVTGTENGEGLGVGERGIREGGLGV